MKIIKNKFYLLSLITILFVVQVAFLLPNKGMAPAWSTAYFSGSVEYSIFGTWIYDINQVDIFKSLKGFDIYFHSFEGSNKKIVENNYNSMGYLYLVLFAKSIFRFLGPIGAIVLLQLLVHIITSYLIVVGIKKDENKLLFIIFYFLNPLVLYFTIYPFYYFWQVVPSFIVLYILNQQKLSATSIIFLLSLITFSVIIRQTTILVSLIGFFLLVKKLSNKLKIVGIILPLLILFSYNKYFNSTKGMSPWHTIYIGIGAYPNNIMQGVSDNNGYSKYELLTSEKVDASLEGNIQNDIEFRNRYFERIKLEYFSVLKENPTVILRNAFLNFFAAFSIGYHGKFPFMINLFISFMGLLIAMLYIKNRMYIEFLIISFSHITFTLYYPPIYAYFFGSILLNVYFGIELFGRCFFNEKPNFEGSINS
jgi:hypothetical protein